MPKKSALSFEARSSDPVCVGIRIMDRDGEVWGYGQPELEYQPLCVTSDQQWTSFTLPITANHPNWFKFPHSGNIDLGNNILEAEVLALVTFDLGLQGQDSLQTGQAILDIRNIELKPDDS